MQWKKIASLCAMSAAMAGIFPLNAYAVSDDDLNQIRQSIQQLEQRHDEDAQHIKELENKLKNYEAAASRPASPAQAPTTAPQPALETQASAIEPRTAAAPASPNSFNPAISAVLRQARNAAFALTMSISVATKRGYDIEARQPDRLAVRPKTMIVAKM